MDTDNAYIFPDRFFLILIPPSSPSKGVLKGMEKHNLEKSFKREQKSGK